VVTHDPRIVAFADRVINIEDGLLVERPSEESELLRLPKAVGFGSVAAARTD